MTLHFFFAVSGKFRRITENKLQRREDGCMTQIFVAKAPPTPQFYCAYRSIQAARISPGARLEILRGRGFTSRRPPASLATTRLSLSSVAPLPLGRFFLFLVRLRFPRRRIQSLDKCYNDFFSLRARTGTNFRRSDNLTSVVLAACLRRVVTRDKSRAYSMFEW